MTQQGVDFISGQVLAIDKPLHWTSFDVVKRVRGMLTRRHGCKRFKVGHAGTLDPLATGVMLVCTGRATKQIEALQAGEKEYVATLRLGATTPSYDLETPIDSTAPTDHITPAMVADVLPRFTGEIQQVPPVFSAIKLDGKRAYKSARKGQEIELDARPVMIRELELLSCQLPEVKLRVVCGKGTYIRSLARDIGQALGCGAHLTALRRTRVGQTTIHQCLDVEALIPFLKEVPIIIPADSNCRDARPVRPIPD